MPDDTAVLGRPSEHEHPIRLTHHDLPDESGIGIPHGSRQGRERFLTRTCLRPDEVGLLEVARVDVRHLAGLPKGDNTVALGLDAGQLTSA